MLTMNSPGLVVILSIKDEVASKQEALESLIDLVKEKGGRVLQRLDIINGLEVEFEDSLVSSIRELENEFSSTASLEVQSTLHILSSESLYSGDGADDF